jgi:hypothetical protein
MIRHVRPLALLALAFTVACSKDAAPGADTAAPAAASAAPRSSDQELADVTSYRLSMDKVDKYMAAQRNVAVRMKDMTPAERDAVKARMESGGDQNESLDQMVRRIEGEPTLNGAIRDAGLSAREYTLLTVSMMQSAMAAGVLKMRPKENQDSLVKEMKANPENVRFIQQNEAELQRKQEAMAAEMKRLGVPTDG